MDPGASCLTGPVSNQVVQRAGDDTATVRLEGRFDTPTTLSIVATDSASLATVEVRPGPIRTEVDLPTGGPYSILDDHGTILVDHLLIGDLWVLAGQSNMAGAGRFPAVVEPHPLVAVFDQTGLWRTAADPVHNGSTSRFPAHRDPDGTVQAAGGRTGEVDGDVGVSCATAFGRAVVEATGVPVGLLPTAVEGRSLAQWDPRLAPLGGDSLYGALLATVADAGGTVAGVLWHQGESDTFTPELAASYGRETTRVLHALRRDLGDVPVWMAQLGRATLPDGTWPGWSAVREHQRRSADLGACGVVATIDLPLDDAIHLSADGLARLGRRFAVLATGQRPPIEIERIAVGTDESTVSIEVAGVVGELQPAHSDGGFTVWTPRAEQRDVVVDAAVSPTTGGVRIDVHLSQPWSWGDQLAYGLGHDPTAPFVDDGDFALPCFGPLAPEMVAE